jgi:hypothetical protein
MAEYSMGAGLDAIDALEKLWKASDNFKSKDFTKKYRKAIHELDDKRTNLMKSISSPKTNEETKQQLMLEVEEIQLTFAELKRLSDTIYDLMNTYPEKMPKPVENAWAIFSNCIWGSLMFPFFLGFRAGNIFALKYGNTWQSQT